MHLFHHEDKPFISINGKDYFLLRGYRINRDNFIFVQVYGKTPLRAEDMPTKDWEIVRTRAGKQTVWTAYAKRYFQYDSQRENPKFAFIGATTQGAYFLTLSHVAKRFGLRFGTGQLQKAATHFTQADSHPRFDRLKDCGCSGAACIVVAFDSFFDEERAKSLFEEAGL